MRKYSVNKLPSDIHASTSKLRIVDSSQIGRGIARSIIGESRLRMN
ncbi:MAG: hypothetical protein ACI9RU_002867 [Litorivivens sp.]|jgi:hypothetical protein